MAVVWLSCVIVGCGWTILFLPRKEQERQAKIKDKETKAAKAKAERLRKKAEEKNKPRKAKAKAQAQAGEAEENQGGGGDNSSKGKGKDQRRPRMQLIDDGTILSLKFNKGNIAPVFQQVIDFADAIVATWACIGCLSQWPDPNLDSSCDSWVSELCCQVLSRCDSHLGCTCLSGPAQRASLVASFQKLELPVFLVSKASDSPAILRLKKGQEKKIMGSTADLMSNKQRNAFAKSINAAT